MKLPKVSKLCSQLFRGIHSLERINFLFVRNQSIKMCKLPRGNMQKETRNHLSVFGAFVFVGLLILFFADEKQRYPGKPEYVFMKIKIVREYTRTNKVVVEFEDDTTHHVGYPMPMRNEFKSRHDTEHNCYLIRIINTKIGEDDRVGENEYYMDDIKNYPLSTCDQREYLNDFKK